MTNTDTINGASRATLRDSIAEKCISRAAMILVDQYYEDKEADMLPLFYGVLISFSKGNSLGGTVILHGRDELFIKKMADRKFSEGYSFVTMNVEGLIASDHFEFHDNPESLSDIKIVTPGRHISAILKRDLKLDVPGTAVTALVSLAEITHRSTLSMMKVHRDEMAMGLNSKSTKVQIHAFGPGLKDISVKMTGSNDDVVTPHAITIDRETFRRMNDDQLCEALDALMSQTIYADLY